MVQRGGVGAFPLLRTAAQVAFTMNPTASPERGRKRIGVSEGRAGSVVTGTKKNLCYNMNFSCTCLIVCREGGMPSSKVTWEQVQRARAFRKKPTRAEAIAWELLRDHRLWGLKFKRQEPLEGFYPDMYCHKLRLVLEIDGGIHDEPEVAEHDRVRTLYLESKGYRVLRIRNEHVSELGLKRLLAPLTRWKKEVREFMKNDSSSPAPPQDSR